MMRIARFILLLAGLWLALAAAVAPVRAAGMAGDYLLDVWTSENGLPDSSVTAVAQTPDGYLWIGTYNGLARFDGVRFVTFDPANTPALTHARVRKLFVDSRGVLWINGYDGSLVTYAGGVFTPESHNVRFAEGELTMVSSAADTVVFLTGRGDLFRKLVGQAPGEGWDQLPPPMRGVNSFCGQDGSGTVWYRDGDKQQLWRLKGDEFEPLPEGAGLAGQKVNCLTTDVAGGLWVGTDQGMFNWAGERFQPATPGGEAGPVPVNFLSVAADSNIWAVVNGSVGKARGGRWVFPPGATGKVFGANPGRIGAQDDHHGGMWFYNYGLGVVHVSASGQVRQLGTEDGFPGDRVYCFFEDKEGDWWAGLDAGGLVRVRERRFRTIITGEKNLMKAAKTVAGDADGSIWIGSLSGGLGRWREGSFANFAAIQAAGVGSVFCVCPDGHGRLWLSAGDEDLYLCEAGQVRRVLPVIHGVKSILADHSGRIWFGTTGGLFLTENGSPEAIQPFKGGTWRYIRALAEDHFGAIWGGTGSGELFRIAIDKVSTYRPADSPEATAVWSVLADVDGTVWVGTFRGGLLRFRDGQFTRFGKKDGLPDNVICQILDDGRGNLWLGSHQGIFCVAKADLENFSQGRSTYIASIDYGRSDGLPSLECSGGYQPAAWHDRAGRLWFTTVKGATWVQPDQTRLNVTRPPVVIESLVVDGQELRLDAGGNLAGRSEIIIPPGKHQIEFRYTGLSLAAPERVQFRRQLDSVDPGWLLAGTLRSAQYNFLPPGHYRFRVIACNSDGFWNETGAVLAVHILPHFYETWWFRVLVVVLVLGGVAGFVRQAATRRLRQKMEELERRQMVERERARIAKDIHDDLGASLTLIAVLGDLAKKEKAGERLEKMSSTARSAVKSLDEIVWAVNPSNDTLAHLIDYTGQFAADYLRDAGMRCLLDVPDHAPVREVPSNVRHNLFLAVKEALQNIVKHAHCTEVWLRIRIHGDGLTVAVEDNGCGFEHAPKDAWADGLRNMRQRLAEIGGECRIESQVGKGTTITIELNLPGGPAHTFIR